MRRIVKAFICLVLAAFISGCSDLEQPSDSGTMFGEGGEPAEVEITDDSKREFTGEDYTINWTDEGFEAIARDYLKKPVGDIYASEMVDVEYISLDKEFEHLPSVQFGFKTGVFDEYGIAEYKLHQSPLVKNNIWKIKSLEDLQHFTSLTSLSLIGFIVDDMSYLENIPHLEKLALIDCQNIEANYSERHLNLDAITYLENLAFLRIEHNGVKDLSPLSQLQGLRVLEVDGEKINDYSPLSSLNLELLDIWDSKLTDISFAAGLSNLKDLRLWVDSVDVGHLVSMANLTNLKINSKEITNLSAINNNLNLKKISLWANNITDISVLKDLPNLSSITINTNKYGDVTEDDIRAMNGIILTLSEMKNLKSLNLYLSRNLDFSPIGKLTGLTGLSVERAWISDIEFVRSLVNLSYLNLARNSISDISPLEGLNKLEELNLDMNYGLVDISPLENLRSLKYLNMLNNSVKNWSPVEHIVKVDGRR